MPNNNAQVNNIDTEGNSTGTTDSNANTVGDQNDTNSGSNHTSGYTYDEDEYRGNTGNAASQYNDLDTSLTSVDTGKKDDVGNAIKPILTSGTIGGIFGMPYQFLNTVDRRINVDGTTDDKMGRKYAEKVAGHLPLLFLTPCRPKFMEGYNKSDMNDVLDGLMNGNYDNNNLSKSGRYYTTEFAYNEYYSCVNMMCAEVAYFCGIENEEVLIGGKKKKIGSIDWYSDLRNESFNSYFMAKESVVLYVDGLTTISDSFNNNATESQLASTVNGFADTARELRFILGDSSALSQIAGWAGEAAANIGSELGSALNVSALTGGMLTDLASTGVSTIMNGGRLLFPKIWGDSTFSRSYSFDLKLRSPDHDSVSIFMNILAPYIHLLALCMPQSITMGEGAGSPNAYNSPFLLRAYAKGLFNINMGMITDLSVTRGGEAQWNDNGLPTQIDISITIEDLYSVLFMTNPNPDGAHAFGITRGGTPLDVFDNLASLFNMDIVANTEMVDFLANLAGLNVAADSFGRKGRLATFLMGNQLARVPANIYHYFDTGIANLERRLFEVL